MGPCAPILGEGLGGVARKEDNIVEIRLDEVRSIHWLMRQAAYLNFTIVDGQSGEVTAIGRSSRFFRVHNDGDLGSRLLRCDHATHTQG